MADATSCRMGPYDREADDPFAPGPGHARPCLAFFQGGTLLVDLEGRPVVARFRAGGHNLHGVAGEMHHGGITSQLMACVCLSSSCAVGQINVVPGQWQPEWVPATVLVYGPPLDGLLTVIFEDEGEPFRHAIDFEGALGSGSWGLLGCYNVTGRSCIIGSCPSRVRSSC